MLKNCLYCKKEFEYKNPRTLYCNKQCSKKDYYNKNKVKMNKGTMDKYYERMKDPNYRKKMRDKSNIYRRNHVEETKIRNKKERLEIIKILGSKCNNPYHINHGDFIEDIRCLQIDHVNGGGQKERKQFGCNNSRKYYKYVLEKLKNGSKNYQLLCANCNWIKREINNENKKINKL